MRYGASTFIWVSPFSNKALDLVDRIKDFGFDLIEICVEDPGAIDPAAIRARATSVDLGVTVCGAFGPDRDLSSEDESVSKAGMSYLRPMYRPRAGARQPVCLRADVCGRWQYPSPP
jgi:D-psicose/D-tagatose/L-ribulose 3-epimerase